MSVAGPKIFRKTYTVRRFGDEIIVDGYGTTRFEDESVTLNVQPLSADEIAALPEGERRTKRLKAYGDYVFVAADQTTGRRGDWLLYYGKWYECKSSVYWDHTMLCHCKSEFVQVPENETMPSVGEVDSG